MKTAKITDESQLALIPDGAMVTQNSEPHLGYWWNAKTSTAQDDENAGESFRYPFYIHLLDDSEKQAFSVLKDVKFFAAHEGVTISSAWEEKIAFVAITWMLKKGYHSMVECDA
jgi:hypothetical protein